MRSLYLVIGAGCLCAMMGCRRAALPKATKAPGVASAPAAPVRSPVAAAAPAPTPTPTEPADVELLHSVPSVIAVSSVVTSTSDLPEYIADGNLETTWNSRTGDLLGAWIDIRVPREVHVSSIRLTAGYPRVKPKGDLFVMNHRIRKVRLFREGAPIGDFTLDPEQRELQPLPVDVPGGDFRILVLETLAGTKPQWRELCVSELQVWGRLPPGLSASPQKPVIKIGTLDVPPRPTTRGPLAPKRLSGPFPTLAAYEKASSVVVKAVSLAGGPPEIESPAVPYLKVQLIDVAAAAHLAIQTSAGWFITEDSLGGARLAVEEFYLDTRNAGATPTVIGVFNEELGSGFPKNCTLMMILCGIGLSRQPSCTPLLTIASASTSCSGAKDESQWDFKLEPSWSTGSELSFKIDKGASSGPVECGEGFNGKEAERACRRQEKELSARISQSMTEDVKALLKPQVLVFP